ncbi:hypothetical protein BKA70DRAFT_1571399 [Coprinopsis sp. MPI-PUGE-AT-0042]|nr:hypothetical protein BKA70DRAFT_1571399 [Coprinopsis sp. MPI-PUGE-AT-0042]
MLPLDVVEAIVVTLAVGGHLEDVRQCALANKSLSPICQKQLYREVRLCEPRDWSLPGNTTHLVDPVNRFCVHLSNYPHLAAYVHELEIVCMAEKDGKIDFTLFDQLSRVTKFALGFPGSNRQATRGRSWLEFPTETEAQILSFLQRNPISSLSLVCMFDIPLSLFNFCSQVRHLSVYKVTPGCDVAGDVPEAMMLEDLEIDHCLPEFGERFILSSSPAIDISGALRLRVASKKNEEDSTLHKILECSDHLKVLDLSLERMFDDWTCAGNVLTRLSPFSVARLKKITLLISTYAHVYGGPPQFELPPMGGIIEELACISGRNTVEEISLTLEVSHETALPLDVAKYQELDNVLSTGYPKLHTFRVSMIKFFCDHPEDPWQGAADFEQECGALFKEYFGWCRRNLDFSVEVEGIVI